MRFCSLLSRFGSARAVALLAGALGLSSCSESGPDWPSQELEQSEHFRYYIRPDDSLRCTGITQDLERQRSLVFDYFGELQTGETIDYYRFRDEADLREHSPCPQSDTRQMPKACQQYHQIWALNPMMQHELIHAYMEPRGRSAQFLEEGIAEALSCGTVQRMMHDLDLADLVAWNENIDILAKYDEASLFVGHLLNIGGPTAFLSLRDQLVWSSNLAQVRAAVQAVYGTSADELYAASQSTASEAGCVPLWECSGSAWDTSTSSFSGQGVCGEPNYAPFDVTEPSLFLGFVAQLHSCAPQFVSPAAHSGYTVPRLVALEPGRYFLGLPGDPTADVVPFSVPTQLLPLSRAIGSPTDCSTLQNIDLPIGELAFVPRTLLQGRAGPVVLRWNDHELPQRRQFTSPDVRLALSAECGDGVDIQVCEGCDESACHPLCSPTVPPDIPHDLVLRLSFDPAALDTIFQINPQVLEVPL